VSALAPAAVERCAATGITKPECHCTGCLAALVARHRPAARKNGALAPVGLASSAINSKDGSTRA
jgi:hypothetical protein